MRQWIEFSFVRAESVSGASAVDRGVGGTPAVRSCAAHRSLTQLLRAGHPNSVGRAVDPDIGVRSVQLGQASKTHKTMINKTKSLKVLENLQSKNAQPTL